MKAKNKKRQILYPALSWLAIGVWIVTVAIASQTSLMSGPIVSLGLDSANRIVDIVLLAPIALISFFLTYKINPRFSTGGTQTSKASRGSILFSIITTAIILVVARYLYVMISAVLHFQFGM